MIGLTSMLPKFAQGIFAATRIAAFKSRASISRFYQAVVLSFVYENQAHILQGGHLQSVLEASITTDSRLAYFGIDMESDPPDNFFS